MTWSCRFPEYAAERWDAADEPAKIARPALAWLSQSGRRWPGTLQAGLSQAAHLARADLARADLARGTSRGPTSRGAAGRAVSGRAVSGRAVSGRAAGAATAALIRSSNDAGRAGGCRGRGCGTALAPGTRRGRPGESSGVAAGTGRFTAAWPSGPGGGGSAPGAVPGTAPAAVAALARCWPPVLAVATTDRGSLRPCRPTPTGARRDDAAPRTGQHMMTCGFNRNDVLCRKSSGARNLPGDHRRPLPRVHSGLLGCQTELARATGACTTPGTRGAL